MSTTTLEKVFMSLGAGAAVASIMLNLNQGFLHYAWQLACLGWIANNWLKLSVLESITKNK